MTIFELTRRSMRKNIRMYYLYFFALIFSISLYFVFATLQHDSRIIQQTSESANYSNAFLVAGILLIIISGVFTLYATHIFLKRRSREIGLYQLIGLSKAWTARFLIVENIILSVGALLVGIGCGALVSRFFLVILTNLLGFHENISLTFSVPAAIQTLIVFSGLIVLTSMQMVRMIYGSTLLQLFHADHHNQHPEKPKAIIASILAVLAIVMIGFGYVRSTQMWDIATADADLLLFNMLTVLFCTILGTYLLFRITIGWLFYKYRKQKNGHLGLLNGLSLAPLMHRMKANANSLTLITVLSAMTLTMIALSYSLYYSTETDTRMLLPYDFAFENMEDAAQGFTEDLEQANIRFHFETIEGLRMAGQIGYPNDDEETYTQHILLLPAEQLQHAQVEIEIPQVGDVFQYDQFARANRDNLAIDSHAPAAVHLGEDGEYGPLWLTDVSLESSMNYNFLGSQLVVAQSTFDEIAGQVNDFSEVEWLTFATYQIEDYRQLEEASELYAAYVPEHAFMPDFHSQYEQMMQWNGLLIFISAFLGLVFLIATGSILYFKQMTEAEEERRSFQTLRQLGFDVSTIMSGIIRKQLFVFMIPLLIGILHASFAVNAASELVFSDITIPSAIAMGMYGLIYIVFALLTIGYYRKVVSAAMGNV